MTWEQVHPAINACLNFTCFCFLIAGRVAIARGDEQLHRKRMLRAFTDRTIYLVTLLTHMVLAVVLVPLVARALFLALRGRFPEHKRIVRFTWPVWLYVSVTGVIVYLMLYHLAPVLHPTFS
jgi:putative membrane protein